MSAKKNRRRGPLIESQKTCVRFFRLRLRGSVGLILDGWGAGATKSRSRKRQNGTYLTLNNRDGESEVRSS